MSYVEGDYRPPGVGDNQSEGEVPPIVALAEQGSPGVIELVNILYATYTLQQSLQAAADQPQEMNTLPVHVDPSFTERYRRASLFVEVAVHIMRGSFIAYPENPEYLRNVLDAAFAPYGFLVAEGTEDSPASTAYRRRIVEQLEQYAQSQKGAKIPYKVLHWQKSDFNEDANDCLWEPVGAWEEEPEVLDFTEHTNMILFLNDQLNGLIIRAEDRMKKQADQVPGLHPYYGERYEYAKEILYQVQDGVMLDGHANDTFYWLNVLACNFNEALYGLDLHIDVNPNWQPEQQPTSEPGHQRGQITRIEEVQP